MILFVFTFFLMAQENIESHQDMIAKAQRLTLQRDRQKAVQILNLSLKNKNMTREQRAEVIQAMNRLSEIFLQDKTQRLYTKAKSQTEDDPNLALDTLDEALAIEPYNVLLYIEKAKFYLKDANCENELNTAQEGLKVNPAYAPLQLLYLQALVCLTEALPEDGFQYENQAGYYPLYTESLYAYLNKNYARALNSIAQGLQKEPRAANYYWLKDKILVAQDLDREENQGLWKDVCEKKEKPVDSLYLDVCRDDFITWSEQ